MTIILNTIEEKSVFEQISNLIKDNDKEIVNTLDMNIAHCMGCNQCWLKTPGICAIKDDYESILKKLVKADNLWLVSDTRFGFLDYKGKRMTMRSISVLSIKVHPTKRCWRTGANVPLPTLVDIRWVLFPWTLLPAWFKTLNTQL